MIFPGLIFEVEVIRKKEDRITVKLKKLLAFCYNGKNLPDSRFGIKEYEDIFEKFANYKLFSSLSEYNIEGEIKQYEV
jgi:hypothetical protein